LRSSVSRILAVFFKEHASFLLGKQYKWNKWHITWNIRHSFQKI